MKKFYIKQKWTVGAEHFWIKDEEGNEIYQVDASFLKIPKSFYIKDKSGEVISQIVKRPWSFFPKFDVSTKDGYSFYLQKKWTFLRDRYQIEQFDLHVAGNIWDTNFRLLDNREQLVAEISKELFHLTSTYKVTLYEENWESLVLSLVIAIDYVEMLESRSNG